MRRGDGQTVEDTPIEVLSRILSDREGDDSVVTGPEDIGYKLTAITAQMDLNQYLAVLNWLDTQMFRAFLLPSLVMTDGSAGSRALGDKHFQIVDRIAEEESQLFTQTIINQLIRPAIEMNFGEQDDYGHFSARPQNIEERERLANMFSSLANAGFMKAYDKTDGDFVRSSLHLPEQDESFYVEPMPNFDPIDDEKPGDEEPLEPKPHSEDGES
jgi:phage gp29-like protein